MPAIRSPFLQTAKPSRRVRLALFAVTLIVAGSLSLLIDLPIARWCKTTEFPSAFLWLLGFSERMANGKDVAVILGCLPFLDPPLRKVFTLRRIPAWADDRLAFPRIVAAAFVSGLVVQAIKASVPRIRPRLANLDGLTNALATFGESAAIESVSRYDRASFPSGHAAVAAGFAAALCWRYPHARPLFVGLAVSAAVQRVVASAHYPSDICIGAAIGLLVAALVLPQRDDRRDSESAGL